MIHITCVSYLINYINTCTDVVLSIFKKGDLTLGVA